jgi:ABC-type lipoprotein export system ATPase subunit
MGAAHAQGNGKPVPIVEARDVHRVGDTRKVRVNVLNGVSLSVAAGEMLSIMGP